MHMDVSSQIYNIIILSSLILVTPRTQITSTTDPLLTFKCTSSDVSAVITWSYSNHLRMYTNDNEHQVIQSLSDGETSTYDSRLIFRSHPYPSDTGERICIATAKFISSNSSKTNTSTKTGKNNIRFVFMDSTIMHYYIKGISHFGMYAIGEEVNVNCVDASNTAEQVEWLNSTGTVLIFSLSSTVTLNIDIITDEHHGLTYTCRIRASDHEIVHDINYNIIVLGTYNTLHYYNC